MIRVRLLYKDEIDTTLVMERPQRGEYIQLLRKGPPLVVLNICHYPHREEGMVGMVEVELGDA